MAEGDNAIPPTGQHRMVSRAGANVDTVASSQAVVVPHPEAGASTVPAAESVA